MMNDPMMVKHQHHLRHHKRYQGNLHIVGLRQQMDCKIDLYAYVSTYSFYRCIIIFRQF